MVGTVVPHLIRSYAIIDEHYSNGKDTVLFAFHPFANAIEILSKILVHL
jgi:hypothetical protein